jgi:hypothetical protein
LSQRYWWHICNFAQANAESKNCKRATKPTLHPKLCQRASKANSREREILKNFQRFKKIKNADTRAVTDNKKVK